MSDFDYRSLNNSAQIAQSREEPIDIEAYLKQELQKGVNGNPQKLSANYERLRDAIELKGVDLELVASQHVGQAKEELVQQARAKTQRALQLLNNLYFQQANRVEARFEPLPPEPVFQGPPKPRTGTLTFFRFLFGSIGGLIAVWFFSNGTIGQISMLGLVGVFGAGFYFTLVLVDNVFLSVFISDEEKHNQAWQEFEVKHAEWKKQKEEYELRQRATKAKDELDNYL